MRAGLRPKSPLISDFQWNLRQIDADDAWLTTSQGAGVKIAILDTGIDPFHLAFVPTAANPTGKVDPASASLLSFSPGCGPYSATELSPTTATNGAASAN